MIYFFNNEQTTTTGVLFQNGVDFFKVEQGSTLNKKKSHSDLNKNHFIKQQSLFDVK